MKSKISLIAILVIVFISVCSLGFMYGSVDVPFSQVFYVFKNKILGVEIAELEKASIYIIWNLRLPRVLLGFFVGGGLAICGVSMQSITRNVMAEPYVLGISSGALAFVSLGLIITGTVNAYLTPILAFVGSLFALLLVIMIGGFSRDTSPAKLILSGTAVSVTLNAVGQYGIYLSSLTYTSNSIVSWMMGSLAGARWDNVLVPIIICTIGLIYFLFNSRAFDLIALGDDTAISLGTNTIAIKRMSLVVVALIAGASVASCGIIGLIGFIIPHIVRFLFGSEHKKLLPLSFFFGGLFLVLMDLIARTVLSPSEIPVGVFTALCGGPYFIWVLRRKSKVR